MHKLKRQMSQLKQVRHRNKRREVLNQLQNLKETKSQKKPDKNVPKSLTTSPRKVLSDRLPKGSDDQIQQHNRFQCLDEEDTDADINHAEPINPNKQGRKIKLNNKK